jgi:hypothetical protein
MAPPAAGRLAGRGAAGDRLCLRRALPDDAQEHRPAALCRADRSRAHARADIGLFWHVWNNGTVVMTMGRWLPPFGITFAADMLGATFALTAGHRRACGGIYALRRRRRTGRRYGFYPFLLLMMAGVTAAFLTGDIFNLYVWFEVLLIGSFGLLVLGSEREQLDGATKYAVPQPDRHDAVPARGRLSLRDLRHAQHGRHIAQGGRYCASTGRCSRLQRCSCSPSR